MVETVFCALRLQSLAWANATWENSLPRGHGGNLPKPGRSPPYTTPWPQGYALNGDILVFPSASLKGWGCRGTSQATPQRGMLSPLLWRAHVWVASIVLSKSPWHPAGAMSAIARFFAAADLFSSHFYSLDYWTRTSAFRSHGGNPAK